jgi:hypothetical protein
MTTQQAGNTRGTASRQSAGPEDRLDVKLLTRAVKELNVCRTHAVMYPSDHPQIVRSIERACEFMQKLCEATPILTLGLAKDCLLFEGQCLDPKSNVFKEFSNALNSRDIATVTFLRGLTKDEIVEFHHILNSDPEEIRNAGGIQEMMKKAAMSHINIQAVDYRFFHLTEEEEISQGLVKDKQIRPVDLWQDFVHHLIMGHLAREAKGISLEAWEDLEPARLSQLMNEHHLNAETVVASYEHVIASQLNRFCDHQSMEKLNTLLKNLQPELRRQFLAVTLDHVQDQADELLSGFSEDVVLEMLQQASQEGREISPTLLTLVRGLAGIDGAMPAFADVGRVQDSVDPMPTPSREHFKRLFDRENYESYVDAEYSATLDRLSEAAEQGAANWAATGAGPDQSDSGDEMAMALREIAESLDDGLLVTRICGILVTLLAQEVDADDYEVFSQKVVEYLPDLLEIGEFELALRFLVLFRSHAAEGPDSIAALADKAIEGSTSPAIAAKAVEAFRRFHGKQRWEATAFLRALGGQCVPWLMVLFAREEFPSSNKALLQLLEHFAKDTLVEAYRRLSDPREQLLRNLLAFIQNHGDTDAIPHIRPLLKHPSHWVRMDALSMLLALGDSGTLESLRTALHSRVPEEFSRAIGLVGSYRIAELVDDLTAMLRVTAFRRSHYRRNEEIIRILGRVGDPKVLPLLERIARKSWVIFPSEHAKVKLAVFESLVGYPREHLSDILRIGLESKDFRIRTVSNIIFKGSQ